MTGRPSGCVSGSALTFFWRTYPHLTVWWGIWGHLAVELLEAMFGICWFLGQLGGIHGLSWPALWPERTFVVLMLGPAFGPFWRHTGPCGCYVALEKRSSWHQMKAAGEHLSSLSFARSHPWIWEPFPLVPWWSLLCQFDRRLAVTTVWWLDGLMVWQLAVVCFWLVDACCVLVFFFLWWLWWLNSFVMVA